MVKVAQIAFCMIAFPAGLGLRMPEYGDDLLRDLAVQDRVVVASVVPGTQQMAADAFKSVCPVGKSGAERVKANGGARHAHPSSDNRRRVSGGDLERQRQNGHGERSTAAGRYDPECHEGREG